jgi:sugar lactone lactonase YvrE
MTRKPDIVEIAACRNILGEVPVWDVEEQALYWVDIEGKRLQRWHQPSGKLSDWHFAERIGSFALRKKGGLVCAFESGFAFFNLADETTEWIARPDAGDPGNRFNDGKCDRHGRFWAGTMDDGLKRHSGSLFRLDPDLSVHSMATGVGISNALCWSPDDDVFYFADTLDKTIYAYDYAPETGAISNKRRFADTIADPGAPDGSTIDAEGYMWNAQWDGWRLTRYAPDGRVDRIVELPVQKPTSCMFGGPDLRTLFVTTAIWDLKGPALAAQPMAGSLLALDIGVAGLPETRFDG